MMSFGRSSLHTFRFSYQRRGIRNALNTSNYLPCLRVIGAHAGHRPWRSILTRLVCEAWKRTAANAKDPNPSGALRSDERRACVRTIANGAHGPTRSIVFGLLVSFGHQQYYAPTREGHCRGGDQPYGKGFGVRPGYWLQRRNAA